MATPSDLTLAQVNAAITALEKQLDVDLQNVINSHSSQISTVQNLHDKLINLLEGARTSAGMSMDPGADWVLWLNTAIGLELKSYAKLINTILDVPLGMCTYLGGGPVCMSQAQCSTLPDFSWNPPCTS